MTQEKQILAYLMAGNSLTQLEALNLFGCLRLGGRIHELRSLGHMIITEHYLTLSGKRVARYHYISEEVAKRQKVKSLQDRLAAYDWFENVLPTLTG